ncbi:O-antigen ligase family protein [uncultured Desulfosarcina sp.]|uniref:O-antigen ligase family protein n=1 Tax=uncultured Desulfosarcina sp. TaxID=218289 RepID=UPI0029C7118A|nr:O-antigen ligase family protein [uncultured Desulfosarcina sp.]
MIDSRINNIRTNSPKTSSEANTNIPEELAGIKNQVCLHSDSSSVLEATACFCLFTYIFLNPFSHITSAKEIFLYGGFSAFLLALIKKELSIAEIQKVPLIKVFLLFTVWAFLGLFSSIDVSNSVHDFYSYLLRYLILYVILVFVLQKEKRIELLGKLIVVSVFMISVYLMYKHFISDGKSIHMKLRTDLPEMPVNWVGFLLVFAVTLAVKFIFDPGVKKNKIMVRFFMVLALAVFFLVTVITQSRATTISVCFVFLAGFFFRSWKNGVVLLVLVLMIFFFSPVKKRFNPSGIFGDVRVGLLFSSIKIVQEYPIFGLGYGFKCFANTDLDNLKKKFPDLYEKLVPNRFKKLIVTGKSRRVIQFGDPHNIFSSVAVRTGVIGGLFFVAVLGAFWRNTWRLAQDNCSEFHRFYGVTILSAFSGVLFIAIMEPVGNHLFHTVFFTLLGMGSALSMHRNFAVRPNVEGNYVQPIQSCGSNP